MVLMVIEKVVPSVDFDRLRRDDGIMMAVPVDESVIIVCLIGNVVISSVL